MNDKSIATLLLGAALALSLPAWAHTDDYLDTLAAPHGGQLRMAGPYHLELVAKDKELLLYVTDHGDQPIATEGGVGKATVQLGTAKTRTTVVLEPAGDNVFKGSGEFAVKPQSVIVAFVKLPGEEAQSARFTPLKPKARPAATKKPASKPAADGHSGHHHHMQH